MARWKLDRKVILITGGARGIGAAVARELDARGARVVLADVDKVALADTAASFADPPQTIELDVTDLDSCTSAVAAVLDRHGRLDVVWANAGIGAGGAVELVDPDAWDRVIEVNLLGAFRTVRAALPAIIAAKGYIAVTASLASFAHAPSLSAYAASKAGVEAFADSLRVEVAHQGVRVGVLHPTWIATDMVADGDRESPAFRLLRGALRPPFRKTYPLESIVGPVADGFARRRNKIFLPGFVRVAHLGRALVNTKAAQYDAYKVAPEMRRLFEEQIRTEGARAASLGSRWS